jgi:transcriptional regulator with XRE-family HTH domain
MADKASDAGTETVYPAYNAQIHPAVAEKLYALGATQSDVAEAFGVSLKEISDWEREHVEFYGAGERGRSLATCEVETALHKRATGYVESGERLMKVHGELVIATHRRQLPPNVAAIRFLLTKEKTARDLSGDHIRDSLKRLKPKTVFDIAAENEKKRKNGIREDE